jgi:hypothetical protein
VLKLLVALDALRRPERLDLPLAACMADKRGSLGHEQDDYPQAAWLREARDAAASVDAPVLSPRDCKARPSAPRWNGPGPGHRTK